MLQRQRVSQQGSLQQMLMSLFLIQMTKMMVSLCTLHGCSLAPFCHSAVMSCLPWLESGPKDMTSFLQQSLLCHIAVAASHASACRSQRNCAPNSCPTSVTQELDSTMSFSSGSACWPCWPIVMNVLCAHATYNLHLYDLRLFLHAVTA